MTDDRTREARMTDPTPPSVTAHEGLLPCPFCASSNIDPEGWMSCEPDGSDKKTGPACDDCGASVASVKIWNTRAALTARVEPVAWRYEVWCGENSWSTQFTSDKPAGNKWQRNITPLYAAPPTETMREALKHYATQYCEGWCKDNGGNFDDCGGCAARLALALSDAGERG